MTGTSVRPVYQLADDRNADCADCRLDKSGNPVFKHLFQWVTDLTGESRVHGQIPAEN